ncbi:MAG: DUF5060 domain-containing protein [Candidatus Brocadiia bacterium]
MRGHTAWLVALVALGAVDAARAAGRVPRIKGVTAEALRERHPWEKVPPQPDVGRFQPVELTIRLDAAFDNPYDPDDIEVTAHIQEPGGRVRSVCGFLYQDYERKLADGQERLSPKGRPVWKARYAPTALGRHTYRVAVRTRNGVAEGGEGAFECVPSESPGFVRVSRRNPRYFEFSTGKPYFPIGHNVCWADSALKTFDYERYFRKMAGAHENFTRIWMCSWSLELEGPRLDDYRLDNAWRLDLVLRSARKHGVYFKLCFDNFYDFTQHRHGPYWRANGGMCDAPRDFFLKPEARRHYRRRLRYIVARWGHATPIMAWELWNEMDYARSDRGRVRSSKEPYMLEWTSEMAAHLERTDPYDHPITNTLAAYTDWPEFWSLPALDFVQLHAYIYEDWEPTPKQYDAAALVLDQARDFQHYRKPFLVAELGYHPSGGANPLNKLDKLGIHLHNALWASSLSGAAGAPMLWWWDNYVDPNDLYYHYRALGRFLEGVDWTGRPWVPLRDHGEGNLRLVGLRTDSLALLWFQDRRNTWHRRLKDKQPPPLLQPFTLRVPGLKPGRYQLTWFDTYNGTVITHTEAQADGRGLLVRLSRLVKAPDVACKIRPYEQPAMPLPSW